MNDKEKNYNSHAKFMADIALAILEGNKDVLDVNGVKEIISLYLLIPYIYKGPSGQLQTPGPNYIVPKVRGNFCDDITLENLRDALCHSFITTEEDKNDGTMHGKYLILDDRAKYSRKEHDKLSSKLGTTCIDTNYSHRKLVELFNEIINN